MSSELKPCPFCGRDGFLDPHNDADPNTFWYIYCSGHREGCRCDIGTFDTKAEAIAAWNRRAPSPDMREALEALRVESEIVENLAWAVEQSTAKAEVLEEALKTVQASLVAAMSLIIRAEDEKKHPSKVVASDAMFLQMLKDYDAATSTGRAALRSLTGAKP